MFQNYKNNTFNNIKVQNLKLFGRINLLKHQYNSNHSPIISLYNSNQLFHRKHNKYDSISYQEQLELKREDFKKFFKNVLITLSYDSKLDEEFKDKQQ